MFDRNNFKLHLMRPWLEDGRAWVAKVDDNLDQALSELSDAASDINNTQN